MAIHKLIFRLDYRTNFEILNEPGTVMSMLDVDNPSYWTFFQDAPQTRLVSAAFNSETGEKFLQMSVDPRSINFVMESKKGVEVGKLEANDDYVRLHKMVGLLCERFKITSLVRSGIRLISVSQVGAEQYDMLASSRKAIAAGTMDRIQATLGDGTDYGVVIDGSHADKSKYHLRFGPYTEGEAKLKGYVESLPVVDDKDRNFVCDIDLYEEAFSLEGITSVKWAKPLIGKAHTIFKELEQGLG